MGRRNQATAEKIAISEVSCEDHVGDFFLLARRNPQRISSEGWNYQWSVLQRCNGRLINRIRRVRPGMCESGDWFLLHFSAPVPQRDNYQAVFGPTKSDCAWPPPVFTRFSTCWLLFVPKSEIPLEGWQVHRTPLQRMTSTKTSRSCMTVQICVYS